MLLKRIANRGNSGPRRNFSLRLVLIVPFVVQICATVGLTGYLSLRNGQKGINDLVNQLQAEVSARIDRHLDDYLTIPHKINQINVDAIALGWLNLRDFQGAGRYFWRQVQVFDVSYISYALSTGEYAGAGYYRDPKNVTVDELSSKTGWKSYTYATDSQGNRTNLAVVVDNYKPQTEVWYKDTVKAGKPIWTPVYQWDEDPDILSATANYPLYDKNTKKIIGVICVDLRLSQISDFLRQLKPSPSGKTFILERNGFLIASSSTEPPYTMVKGGAQRLRAANSTDPLIRATARQLTEQFGNLSQIKADQFLKFNFNGQRQFVRATTWQDQYGLDWLIVVVVPESDFMAQINANTRTTIVLCLGALGLAIGLGILTSRWIARPILRLSEASSAIASGNLNQTVNVKGIKELGVLAASFNQMAAQLRSSFAALEKTNEALEQRVEERTAALKSAKEEAEAAKDAANAANRAKSEFLANMSHELRTPLNGILGYAQILKQDKTVSPKQKDGLAIIYQCGSHLLTLINDVLDISKIEAQKLELYPTDFQVENFLRGVLAICRLKAEQKEIGFCYQALNRLPAAIHADEKRLRQVLLNLLGNAIKFTDKGSVTFKVGVISHLSSVICQEEKPMTKNKGQRTNYKIRFQVEDTGIGMTPEQLEKIFLPFEQVGDRSRHTEGTGLGLTISRRIVQVMGGEINVESTYGEGSKFWFDLDLLEASDALAVESSKSKPLNAIGYQGKRRTILIVDDRTENRLVLVNLLEPLGFKTIEAANGQEGFDKAKEIQPDLIITDLVMPLMDGLEMTRRLRKLEAFKDLVIIASSASVFSFDRQQSQTAGCNDFLPKPIQADELFDQLQRHLSLTWIYETQEELVGEFLSASTEGAGAIAPAPEELTVLYEMAQLGYVLGIIEEANRLKQLNPEYTAFAERVLKLAEEFEDEAIVKLVQPYLF